MPGAERAEAYLRDQADRVDEAAGQEGNSAEGLERRGRFRLWDAAGDVEERRRFVRGEGGDAGYYLSPVRRARREALGYSRLVGGTGPGGAGAGLSEPFRILGACVEALWADKLHGHYADKSASELERGRGLRHWQYMDSHCLSFEGMRWAREYRGPDFQGVAREGGAGGRSAGPGPRLQVENCAYQSKRFRDLHLELACREDGLEVLHCVMYPRARYSLPIFALDMVGVKGKVTFCIVDLAPTLEGALSAAQLAELEDLRALTLPPGLREGGRYELPDWAPGILSEDCLAFRPNGPEEVNAFVQHAYALLSWLLSQQRDWEPVGSDAEVSEVLNRQAEFCRMQLRNDKTRAVLERAFGGDVAEDYMREVMFSLEPVYALPPRTPSAAPPAAGGEAAEGAEGQEVVEEADTLRGVWKPRALSTGPMAKVSLRGKSYWVPRGADWSLAEEAACERLQKVDTVELLQEPGAEAGPRKPRAALGRLAPGRSQTKRAPPSLA